MIFTHLCICQIRASVPSFGSSWNCWASGAQQRIGHATVAEHLTRGCDNLNTHAYASFYRAFPPAEERCLVRRVHLAFTPKHGSWLNMAEMEITSQIRTLRLCGHWLRSEIVNDDTKLPRDGIGCWHVLNPARIDDV